MHSLRGTHLTHVFVNPRCAHARIHAESIDIHTGANNLVDGYFARQPPTQIVFTAGTPYMVLGATTSKFAIIDAATHYCYLVRKSDFLISN